MAEPISHRLYLLAQRLDRIASGLLADTRPGSRTLYADELFEASGQVRGFVVECAGIEDDPVTSAEGEE